MTPVPDSTLHRHLAAILCADVVGYSRMVAADEEGTLVALRELRQSVIEPAIASGGGRIVKHMGDGFLAEFASAVNAVAAACDLQARMGAVNEVLPTDRQFHFRIGINLADIVGEGDDIYGDGVNTAARLEPLAEPGGIVVSAKVRDEATGKTAATFTDIGEQSLKNLASPVRAYRVEKAPVVSTATLPPDSQTDTQLSVAVLPFTSLGADAEQQHFADGVTEDIITELSRVPVLRVAARNSAFRFRGPDADLAIAARTLNVRFIVEGSLRRIGPRIRITAQLIDTTNSAHLWAERYDRPIEDIVDAQDAVVRTIVGTLAGRLQSIWVDHIRSKPTEERSAFDLYMQAELTSWDTVEARREATLLAYKAIKLNPRLARAYAVLAFIAHRNWTDDISSPDSLLDTALQNARISVELAPNDYYPHIAAAYVHRKGGRLGLAIHHLDRAHQLNPNRPGVLVTEAMFAILDGHAADARERLLSARDVDSGFHPSWFWFHLARIEYLAQNYSAALSAFFRIDAPTDLHVAYAAAAHAMLGEDAAAKALADNLLARSPTFTIAALLRRDPYQNIKDRALVAKGMQRAGLPP